MVLLTEKYILAFYSWISDTARQPADRDQDREMH